MENLLFTFTKKNPSEFLVEQRVKSNEQRVKSNEQRAKSNEQQAKSNEQKFHLLLIMNMYFNIVPQLLLKYSLEYCWFISNKNFL